MAPRERSKFTGPEKDNARCPGEPVVARRKRDTGRDEKTHKGRENKSSVRLGIGNHGW